MWSIRLNTSRSLFVCTRRSGRAGASRWVRRCAVRGWVGAWGWVSLLRVAIAMVDTAMYIRSLSKSRFRTSHIHGPARSASEESGGGGEGGGGEGASRPQALWLFARADGLDSARGGARPRARGGARGVAL